MMISEDTPSVKYHKNHEDIFTPRPLPFPPRPSTAIGGFTPRFRTREFDGKSFLSGVLVGVLVTSLFSLILLSFIVYY